MTRRHEVARKGIREWTVHVVQQCEIKSNFISQMKFAELRDYKFLVNI